MLPAVRLTSESPRAATLLPCHRDGEPVLGFDEVIAFFAATNVRLDEFIRLGLYLWELTKKGDVVFTTASLGDSVDPDALAMMYKSASLPLKDYRKRLERERKKGYLAHRRYTFTERPLLEIGTNKLTPTRCSLVG